jgi:amidase
MEALDEDQMRSQPSDARRRDEDTQAAPQRLARASSGEFMTVDLWRWQASELAYAIRTRSINSREAVKASLARLEEVNPKINAVIDVLADEALEAADMADRQVAAAETLGVLHGVPVTIKVNVDVAGRATTNGVVAFKERIAKVDSPCVANWRKAGAIIVGRTNVPPFSARYFTSNALYGATLNPWDRERTPGGSSGGAAAALAAGIGGLAHGNDRAGSIRYPAYACGVLGIRPTLGRVPTYEHTAPAEPSIATQLTNVQGPLARSVRDLRLGLAAMQGRNAHDPWWAPVHDEPASPPHGRVAMFVEPAGLKVDPAVRDAVTTAARWLEDAGYHVEECEPPHFQEAARLFFTLVRTEERAGTTRAIETLGDDALRRARASTMAYATELDLAGYVKAFGRRASILREWLQFFERCPLLLMPVSFERPFPVDFDQRGDNEVARMLTAHHPLLAVSVLGLPGLSVPTGLVDGIPIGVQLVASRYQEELCFTAAEIIESHQPLRTPIDPAF